MIDRSTVLPLPFSFQVLKEDHNGLGFLPSLYPELLLKCVEPYESVSQELRLIRGEIAKLTNKTVCIALFFSLSIYPTFPLSLLMNGQC